MTRGGGGGTRHLGEGLLLKQRYQLMIHRQGGKKDKKKYKSLQFYRFPPVLLYHIDTSLNT